MLSKKIQIARSIAIASLAIFLSGPALAASALPAPATSQVAVPGNRAPAAATSTAASTNTSETQGYAARENKAQGLEQFRGGADGIYIGSGVLVVVLLVVLILVLI
jgi:hypothetical protein